MPDFNGAGAPVGDSLTRLMEKQRMRINEEAVSFAAFSLTKILAAELLRKGILNKEEFLSAIASQIAELRENAAPTNEDAAVLLAVYRDEI